MYYVPFNQGHQQIREKQYITPIRKNSTTTVYKKNITPIQASLFFWEGDNMNKSVNKNNIRFWTQNCNGIKIQDSCNIHHNFTQIHENNIHYFSFTETNLNTSSTIAQSKMWNSFNARFKGERISNTNSPGYPKTSLYQPGGVTSGFSKHL